MYVSKNFFDVIYSKCHERHNPTDDTLVFPVKIVLNAFLFKYHPRCCMWLPDSINGLLSNNTEVQYERECNARLAKAADALVDKINEIYSELKCSDLCDFNDVSHDCTRDYEALLKAFLECYKEFDQFEQAYYKQNTTSKLHYLYAHRDDVGPNAIMCLNFTVGDMIEWYEKQILRIFGLEELARIQMDYDTKMKEAMEEKVCLVSIAAVKPILTRE
jgi:hypothetical protein